MALARIAFKFGSSRLSAAQKRALAKAIKASASKRSRKAKFKAFKITARKGRVAARKVKLTKKLGFSKQLYAGRAARSSKLLLAKTTAENKYKNPSFISKQLGLNNPEKALRNFKRADRAYVRAMVQTTKSEKSIASLQNRLMKAQKLDDKLIKRLAKSNALEILHLNDAKKYAKISGVAIKAADTSMTKAKADALSRSFDKGFYGALAATTGLTVAANVKYKKQNPDGPKIKLDFQGLIKNK